MGHEGETSANYDDEYTVNDEGILRLSLGLLEQAYKEARSSTESVNTRAGITLALIGTFLGATEFEPWYFTCVNCSEDIGLHMLLVLFNIASVILFLTGVTSVVMSLLTNERQTPYRVSELNEQSDKDSPKRFFVINSFYRLQMADYEAAYRVARKTLDKKAQYFNCGIVLVLLAIGFIVAVRLFT